MVIIPSFQPLSYQAYSQVAMLCHHPVQVSQVPIRWPWSAPCNYSRYGASSKGFCCKPHKAALSDWNVSNTPYKESSPSRIQVTWRSPFSLIILVLSLAIPSSDANITTMTLSASSPLPKVSSTLLHQSLYEMASSLVVSLKKRKLTHQFLGLLNSQWGWLCSLHRAQFLRWCLSAEIEWCKCPEVSISHTCWCQVWCPAGWWHCPHPPLPCPPSHIAPGWEFLGGCPGGMGGVQRQAQWSANP